MGLDRKKLLLGVTGGIAAYKSVYLLRLLKRSGADVRVVMTDAACEFIAPLTFESLSEHPVRVRMFGGSGADRPAVVSPIEHIDLARGSDLIVVAPATANTLAGFAHGRADDLLSTIVSASECPIIVAPAMNDVMWASGANQNNLAILSNRGFGVVPPERGDLACGYEATGRMAEPDAIFSAVEARLASPYAGLRVLVSAGGTEEPIDPVRVIANRSSGKMGFALAEAARDMGATTTVIAASTRVPPPHGVRVVPAYSVAEMAAALDREFTDHDVLVMAAAVGDYRARKPSNRKVKGDRLIVEFERTEDILEALGRRKESRIVVGFALETDNAESNAREKLMRKKCDLIVLNDALQPGAAFAHDTNVVTVLDESHVVYKSERPESKRWLARVILELVAGLARFGALSNRPGRKS